MELKKVTLKDKQVIDQYLAYSQEKCCDMCFANIYLWSRRYHVGYAILEGALIFADPDVMDSFCFPYGPEENVKKAISALESWFDEQGKAFSLHLVSPKQYALLDQWFPGKYQIEYDRDEADYVYETEKMVALSGKHYHGKKNHINKFEKSYPDWSYEVIDDENVEDCFTMALDWRNLNECEGDEEKLAEITMTLNALRLMKELNLTGGLIRVDGKVVAFSIGEELNPDMFVVHIEKAYSDVPGAYTIINQQFAAHAAAGYLYLNREDDCGLEGLRKAKESYHPVFLMEKGLVTHR